MSRIPGSGYGSDKPFQRLKARPRTAVTALKAGNYLESSRLLLSDAWAALAAATKGPIVATAPATDVVLFICKPDAAGLTKLTRLTDSVWHTAQRHISRTLLRWSPHGWTELTH